MKIELIKYSTIIYSISCKGDDTVDRPYIFCHMMTSIDGKIMGSYMDTQEGEEASQVFYDIAFGNNPYYKHQGWLSGRITTDDNFTFYKEPQLDDNVYNVSDGDFVVDTSQRMYYVSVDPTGRLGWESNTLTYIDTTAHIIEVLTEQASIAYKAFLRKLNISYIIAGKDSLDYQLAMSKLKHLFHIETLMLGGGGVLNWSFMRAGMCDELSVVIAPVADGSSKTPTLFETRDRYTDDKAIGFDFIDMKVKDKGVVWLRYHVLV